MSHNFGSETTAEEAASTFSDQIKGKTVLITGVSPNGIGLTTAIAIAAHAPALLILAARSQSALDAAASEIHSSSPNVSVKLLQLDIGSIATARKAAEEVLSWDDVPTIDVVINNAGVMSTPWEKSVDGIERQFATNHIGPFVFTNLILPKVIKAKGRVVVLSSAGYKWSPVRFDDVNFGDGKDYNSNTAYGQSKTANILFAVALAEKFGSQGVTAFSVHPGAIMTNLSRHIPNSVLQERGFLDENGKLKDVSELPFKFKTHSQGSSTTIVAAFNPELAEKNGTYLQDCQVDDTVEEYAMSRENAEKLWKLSEELVKQKFEY